MEVVAFFFCLGMLLYFNESRWRMFLGYPVFAIWLCVALYSGRLWSFGSAFFTLGLAANLSVITANRFRMPVVGVPVAEEHKYFEPGGVHVPATEQTRLRFLADQRRFGGASLGDILLLIGVTLLAIRK